MCVNSEGVICPVSNAQWQLWCQDTFDRETPRQVQVEGRGLVAGLAALWSYHLREGVDAQGRPTFLRFNLWWVRCRVSLEIARDSVALARLRAWVVNETRPAQNAAVEKGDRDLVSEIAAAHSRLIFAGGDAPATDASRPILVAAKNAADRTDFSRRLAALAPRPASNPPEVGPHRWR